MSPRKFSNHLTSTQLRSEPTSRGYQMISRGFFLLGRHTQKWVTDFSFYSSLMVLKQNSTKHAFHSRIFPAMFLKLSRKAVFRQKFDTTSTCYKSRLPPLFSEKFYKNLHVFLAEKKTRTLTTGHGWYRITVNCLALNVECFSQVLPWNTWSAEFDVTRTEVCATFHSFWPLFT